jgi:hypothetical protein
LLLLLFLFLKFVFPSNFVMISKKWWFYFLKKEFFILIFN